MAIPRLIIISGAQRGKVINLHTARITIGRGVENGLRIDDDSVSYSHAEITLDGDRVFIRDLGSTNGIKINGVRMAMNELRDGDQITLGQITLYLQTGISDYTPSVQVAAAGSPAPLSTQLPTAQPAPSAISPSTLSPQPVNPLPAPQMVLQPTVESSSLKSISAPAVLPPVQKHVMPQSPPPHPSGANLPAVQSLPSARPVSNKPVTVISGRRSGQPEAALPPAAAPEVAKKISPAISSPPAQQPTPASMLPSQPAPQTAMPSANLQSSSPVLTSVPAEQKIVSSQPSASLSTGGTSPPQTPTAAAMSTPDSPIPSAPAVTPPFSGERRRIRPAQPLAAKLYRKATIRWKRPEGADGGKPAEDPSRAAGAAAESDKAKSRVGTFFFWKFARFIYWRRTGWNYYWKKKGLLRLSLMIVILLVLASFAFQWKPRPQAAPERKYVVSLQEAVGYGAAVEVARVFGQGGAVVLLLPGVHGEKDFQNINTKPYETGFRDALREYPSVQVLGHFVAQQWSAETPQDYSQLTVETLKEIQNQFPAVELVVSFIGLPHVSSGQEGTWQQMTRPKIIAYEVSRTSAEDLRRPLDLGWVEAVLTLKGGATIPQEKPDGTVVEVFERYFQITRRGVATR